VPAILFYSSINKVLLTLVFTFEENTMEDGRYIRTMLQAVAVKEEGKEISPTEAKKLAENLVGNSCQV